MRSRIVESYWLSAPNFKRMSVMIVTIGGVLSQRAQGQSARPGTTNEVGYWIGKSHA